MAAKRMVRSRSLKKRHHRLIMGPWFISDACESILAARFWTLETTVARKWLLTFQVLCKQLMLPIVNGLGVLSGLKSAVEACAGPSPFHPVLAIAAQECIRSGRKDLLVS